MKPNLLIFEKENVENCYINFSKQMKPCVKFRDLSQEEEKKLLEKRNEMLQKIEKEIYQNYLDETNEMSCAFDDEDEFPCRTVMTGNYYICRESYSPRFFGENGHCYDIKNGQYRDLRERDENGNYTHFLPLDSAEVKRGYKVIFEACLTYYDEDEEERDYLSLDYVADICSLDDELVVEELGMECIIGADD